jgi:hypothetical protein
MMRQFEVGDMVSSILTDSRVLYGIIKEVNEKTNKVLVAWSGGSYVQHDPDEIALWMGPVDRETLQSRLASRRAKIAFEVMTGGAEETDDVPPDFVGNPEVHGIDEPRGGGFSIMQNLQKDLRKEETEERSASLKSRRAMYWGGPGRQYRMTKKEQNGVDPICCPKCKESLEVFPFTRKEKLYSCPTCEFKIPSSKVVTEGVVPEPTIVEPETELEILASRRGK